VITRHRVIRCLMGYIVDLSLVLNILFWLIHDRGTSHAVSQQDVAQALKYYTSSLSEGVHRQIRSFVQNLGIIERVRRDHVLDEVVQLINTHRSDVAKFRRIQCKPLDWLSVGRGSAE
jgi:hypothetical protein